MYLKWLEIIIVFADLNYKICLYIKAYMPKYALECTGVRLKFSRMHLIELVMRLGWRYRAEDVIGSLTSTRLVNNK